MTNQKISRVGVVGAGQMGAGIAQVSAAVSLSSAGRQTKMRRRLAVSPAPVASYGPAMSMASTRSSAPRTPP